MSEPSRIWFGPVVRWAHVVVGVVFLGVGFVADRGLIGYLPGVIVLARAPFLWRLPYVEVRPNLVMLRDSYLLVRARRIPLEASQRVYVEDRQLRVWPGGRDIADLRWCGDVDIPDRATVRQRIVDEHRSTTR